MLFGCIYVPDFPVQAALLSEAKIDLSEGPAGNEISGEWRNGSCNGVAGQGTFPHSSPVKSPAETSSDEATLTRTTGKVFSDKTFLIQFFFNNHQIAVLDGPANQMKVFACNEPARRAGIAIGMTKIQAEALPSVALRKRVLDHEFVAHAALLECACRFSPRLESTCPGTVIIDLTGTERLTGTKKKIAEKLRDAAQECGLSVNVALASNADTALYAAIGVQGVTLIQDGEEAQRLGDLPIGLFQVAGVQFDRIQITNHQFTNHQIANHPLTNSKSGSSAAGRLRSGKSSGAQPDIADIMDSLSGWGIRNFKALAALPAVALTQRLGQYGLHLQRLAKGEVQRELVPYVEASSFQQSIELEETIELLEPLGVVLSELLERILMQLINRALATDRIQIDLDLEIHSDSQIQPAGQQQAALEPKYQRVLKLPVPTQDANTLLKLLELNLAGKPPHAPVKKVSVEAFPARIKFGQGGLFQPVAPEPAKLEVTLARLRSVVSDKVAGDGVFCDKDEQGRSLVGFPVILDSNRPDSFDVLATMPSTKGRKSKARDSGLGKSKSIVPRHAMRVLRPPAEVKVGLRASVPVTISFGDVRSKVVQVSGPWRTSGSWWDQNQAWNREEWDVEVQWQEGHAGFDHTSPAHAKAGHAITSQAGSRQAGVRQAIFRIFRDAASGRWYVEGIYA